MENILLKEIQKFALTDLFWEKFVDHGRLLFLYMNQPKRLRQQPLLFQKVYNYMEKNIHLFQVDVRQWPDELKVIVLDFLKSLPDEA